MTSITLENAEKPIRPGKIVCLGRNYAEHIKELGNDTPDQPVIFIKPATSIIADGETMIIPSYSKDCHHEAELAVLIGKKGKNIAEAEAMTYVAGYGIAIDMTLRDVQADLKKKGLPWEVAKAFDTSCPLSPFVAAATIADPHQLAIRLWVNDELRQDATTALMMRRIPQMICEISAIFTLEEGDVILTGTPAGVGPVKAGDRMRAEIEAVGRIEVRVA